MQNSKSPSLDYYKTLGQNDDKSRKVNTLKLMLITPDVTL